jgi:hypothetical protein
MQTMTKVTDEIAPDRTGEVRIPSEPEMGGLKSLLLSKNEIHTQFRKRTEGVVCHSWQRWIIEKDKMFNVVTDFQNIWTDKLFQ